MKKAITILFILLALGGAKAQTNQLKTFSLKQAVEYGIQNNLTAKNAKLSETEARARNHELLSMGLPQVNGEFDYQYYIVKPSSPAIGAAFSSIPGFGSLFPPGEKIYFVLPNNATVGATLNQLVYDTRYFIGIQTFKSLIKLSQQQTALTNQDVRYNIIKGYCEVQAAKEILRTLDSNLLIIRKLLHDTREIYKEGLTEETDVNRLELGESTLISQINNTKNLYDLGLSALKYNMGLQLTDNIALTDDIESLRRQISSAGSGSFDPNQRIEAQLLQTSITLKTYDMKQRRSGYYPSIYAFLNFGGGSQVNYVHDFFVKQDLGNGQTQSNWYMQSYVGFTIKVPIIDGGQKMASVKQAKIELDKAKNDFENFRNQSTLQVDAASTTFMTNLAEEQNAKESMRLNTKIFSKTETKFKEGVSSSFELMQTQQDLTSNQIRYYSAVKNVLTSRADLDKALGIQ